jgi:hypothetical protein
MNFSRLTITLAMLAIVAFFSGCSDEGNPAKPPVDTEHPPPTTVTLQLTQLDASGNPTGETTSVTVRDTTQTPIKIPVDGILRLHAGASYKGVLILRDESKTPAEDVTADILAEKDAHIFIFTPDASVHSVLAVSDLDKDNNGFNFGLNFKVTTSGIGAGNINVVLRHYDSGDKNDNEYDTDIDRNFPVVITE